MQQPTKPELINYSRSEGKFDLAIKLVRNKFIKSKKAEGPENGITKFTFVFTDTDPNSEF